MPKFAEGLADRLKVPPGKRDVQIFDDGLPGFGIRKFDSGRAVGTSGEGRLRPKHFRPHSERSAGPSDAHFFQ